MRADWRARLLGFATAAAALPVLFAVPEPVGPVLGAGLAVAGLFVAVVAAERAVPAPAAEALLRGDAATLQQVAEGLKLQGRPVYVHDQGNVGAERLFLPASENEKPVPILDPATVLYSGGSETKIGVAVAPAGLALLQAHEAATGESLRGAPLQEVEQQLQHLAADNDLARGMTVIAEGADLTVRFASGGVRPPCFDDPSTPLCEKTGCALCQAVGCALARSLGRPIEVREAHVEVPWVTLRLDAREDLA